VASLFVLFLGNRLVAPTLFITSFFTAGVAALCVVPAIADAADLEGTASCILVGVAPALFGLVAAGLAFFFLNLGFALLGGAAGAGLGYIMYAAFLQRFPLYVVGSTNVMFILCMSIGAIAGMLVLIRQKKNVLIVATSAAGAAGATPAIVLLLAHTNIKFLGAFNTSLNVPPQFVWPQALVAAGLFALGLLVQCRLESNMKRRRVVNEGLRNSRVPLIVP